MPVDYGLLNYYDDMLPIYFITLNIQELNGELSKNKKIDKYSIIEYDADDIV